MSYDRGTLVVSVLRPVNCEQHQSLYYYYYNYSKQSRGACCFIPLQNVRIRFHLGRVRGVWRTYCRYLFYVALLVPIVHDLPFVYMVAYALSSPNELITSYQ